MAPSPRRRRGSLMVLHPLHFALATDRHRVRESSGIPGDREPIVSDAFLAHLRSSLAEIDAAGLTKRERLIAGPQGGRIKVAADGATREMLNLCANNYLGLADHPDVIAAAKRGARRIRLRHGLGALHLRRADAAPRARAGDRRLSRQGRRHPVRRLLRRQRRRVRAAARRGRRDHLRRAQPRLDHRRRAALQGRAATATPHATWTSSRTR